VRWMRGADSNWEAKYNTRIESTRSLNRLQRVVLDAREDYEDKVKPSTAVQGKGSVFVTSWIRFTARGKAFDRVMIVIQMKLITQC
jgi:hypothetical protein